MIYRILRDDAATRFTAARTLLCQCVLTAVKPRRCAHRLAHFITPFQDVCAKLYVTIMPVIPDDQVSTAGHRSQQIRRFSWLRLFRRRRGRPATRPNELLRRRQYALFSTRLMLMLPIAQAMPPRFKRVEEFRGRRLQQAARVPARDGRGR